MTDIQRCINLMAGVFHRADPNAFVTSGADNFNTITDVNPALNERELNLEKVESYSSQLLGKLVNEFNIIHSTNLTAGQFISYIKKIISTLNFNFYRDNLLIAAGGDTAGTLDFYYVHYYQQNGNLNSFLYPYSYWQLNKPLVVAEFFMNDDNGILRQFLYPWLYQNGYAGALVWSWTAFPLSSLSSSSETWSTINYMFNNYSQDIAINILTGVDATKPVIPKTFFLYQNYPNPFNPTTIINYQIPNNSFVTLKVYDILGNLVKIPVDGYKAQGKYSIKFDGSNLASGEYFYRLRA